jgi:hypothetical protein
MEDGEFAHLSFKRTIPLVLPDYLRQLNFRPERPTL